MRNTRFCFLFFVVIAIVAEGSVWADRVFVRDGFGRTRNGKVTLVTREGVTIESASRSETVAAFQIAYTVFDDDPARLLTVRTAVAAGRWDEAHEELGKVPLPTTASIWTQQDYRFLTLAIRAHRALDAGVGGVNSDESARESRSQSAELGIAFLTDFPQSYHYYAVCRMVVGLLASLDDTDALARVLEILASAPWPRERLHAAVALGDLALVRGEIDTARQHWTGVVRDAVAELAGADGAVAATTETPAESLAEFTTLKRRAEIGLARCLAAETKWDEAEQILGDLIVRTERGRAGEQGTTTPDPVALAALFNALGDTLRNRGTFGDAAIAYLHTELLYPSARREWLYALHQLEEIWRRLDKPDRAAATAAKIRHAALSMSGQ